MDRHELFPLLTGYEHVFWDWNGTLLDDVQCCHRILCELLADHALPPITLERYRRVFRFPVIDYYRDLGFDFARISYAHLAEDWTARYAACEDEFRLFPGTLETLQALAATRTRSHILTAAPEADVERLAARFGVRPHLQALFGLGDCHARGKIERGRELLAHTGAGPGTAVMVGDTDHDAEVALDLGLDAILLEGGHQAGRDDRPLAEAFAAKGRRLFHARRPA